MNSAEARAARAMLQLGVKEVAKLAGVGPNTVSRIERDVAGVRGPNASTIAAIRSVYEAMGIVFIADGDQVSGGSGVWFDPDLN